MVVRPNGKVRVMWIPSSRYLRRTRCMLVIWDTASPFQCTLSYKNYFISFSIYFSCYFFFHYIFFICIYKRKSLYSLHCLFFFCRKTFFIWFTFGVQCQWSSFCCFFCRHFLFVYIRSSFVFFVLFVWFEEVRNWEC